MYGTVHGKDNDNYVCRLALFGESPHLSAKICPRISNVMEHGHPSESTMQQLLTLAYCSDEKQRSRICAQRSEKRGSHTVKVMVEVSGISGDQVAF